MRLRGLMLAAAALLCAPPGRAFPFRRTQPQRIKPQLRDWFFKENPDSTRLTVPILDVDPVRGVTVGAAPTWFLVSSGTARSIHAPAATYNTNVGAALAYDFYLFPSSREQLELYASVAQTLDREILVDYSALPTTDHPFGLSARGQRLLDATRRFYGIGPDSRSGDVTDYTFDSWNYAVSWARRIVPDGPWSASIGQHLEAARIRAGPAGRFPDLGEKFPGTEGTAKRRVDAALRASIAYDTRRPTLSPKSGAQAEMFMDAARQGWGSDHTYARYGGEMRVFVPMRDRSDPRAILALDCRAESVDGVVPFWLMPSLGGKRSLRSYGDGRFYDDFMAAARAELRLRAGKAVFSGTPVSFWVDPFLESGVVASDPWHAQRRDIRPGYGLALRAVSLPQVVVSADFGFGLEGPKVFLDLTYAF